MTLLPALDPNALILALAGTLAPCPVCQYLWTLSPQDQATWAGVMRMPAVVNSRIVSTFKDSGFTTTAAKVADHRAYSPCQGYSG